MRNIRNIRKKIKPIYKLTIALSIVLLILIFNNLFFNILMGLGIAFQDLDPNGIDETRQFQVYENKNEWVHLYSNSLTKTWSVEIDKEYFNTTIMETKREITYLEIMNNKSDSVGIVVFYSNPNIIGPKIIEFFDYENKDSLGIYYYDWCYYCTKNQKNFEGIFYIDRKDTSLYKKADTIYLKQYLN